MVHGSEQLTTFPRGRGTSAVSAMTLCRGCSGHEKGIPSLERETGSLGIRASRFHLSPQCHSTGFLQLQTTAVSPIPETLHTGASMGVFGSHRVGLCFIYRWLEGTEARLPSCRQGSHLWAELTPSGRLI